MHVVLLTLMALSGANPVAAQQTSGYVTNSATAYASGCSSCGSSVCDGAGCGYGNSHVDRRVNRQLQHYMSGSKHGPMPQTCYAPRFGCYNGNDRFMNRYPAFHGTYYRRPYNYRNLFEYPWHAEMHEPTSFFSYNVPPEAMVMPPDAPPPADAAAQIRNVPMQTRPVTQPAFAPRENRSASFMPAQGEQNVQYLEPPRLSDSDLSGVSTNIQFEEQRVVPAPIETLANATEYVEGKTEQTPTPAVRRPAQPPAEFAPRIATRPITDSPVMLQPLSIDAEPVQAQPVSTQQSTEKKPAIQAETSRRSPTAAMAPPQVKAKPISLGQPQSIELQPIASPHKVTHAAAQEAGPQDSMVQPTTATVPYVETNGLRVGMPKPGVANPLR